VGERLRIPRRNSRGTVTSWPWCRDDDQVIGEITLELDQDQPRMGSFAYVLHRQYWRRGDVTEAMRALFDFGFNQLKLHRIYDACDVRNLASARVMEKLGLRCEGHVRERLWKDGTLHDEY
jgi:[ribosomal protein S5]-alanine N-acetyltransferase